MKPGVCHPAFPCDKGDGSSSFCEEAEPSLYYDEVFPMKKKIKKGK